MSQLLSPETFEFFARYLLAGFVMLSARSRLVTGERPSINETLVEAVILSLINQTVTLLTFAWVPQSWTEANASISLFLQVVLQPAALGFLFGWLVTQSWFPGGLRRLFLPVTRPVNQAFDHAFDRNDNPSFVIIAYHDGRQVLGYFGPRSMVGTDERNGGIFLERLYKLGKDGNWVEAVPNRSAWLALDSVRSIEFLEAED